jgi:hypothetical protein
MQQLLGNVKICEDLPQLTELLNYFSIIQTNEKLAD